MSMSDLEKLQSLKQALSNELATRPAEERERLVRESKERNALRLAWEKEFPWLPLSELTPTQEAEFFRRLQEAAELLAELKRDGVEACLMMAPDEDRNP